ncbi:MAG: hypothetical protein AAGA02_12190 [Bacteroidota bacterium]
MKKLCLSIFVLLTCISMLFAGGKYPSSLSKETVEFLKNEYYLSIVSNSLFKDLENKFKYFFDEVSSVNANYSSISGYYYVVFGEKDGIEKIELLKVEESDVINKTYTYIDFSNITVSEQTVWCKSANGFPPGCPPECIAYTNQFACIGIMCGVGPDCNSQ